MAEKKNYWTQIIGAMNGFLSFGGLSPFKDVTSIRVSINMETAKLDDEIKSNDEIAFFPPMTGG